MLLVKHARAFFSRFLLSRNYKIQIVARVGRKSAALLSGLMEASYPHFFIGRGFNCSIFWCLSRGFKNYHSEASRHLGSRRIELSSKSSILEDEFWKKNTYSCEQVAHVLKLWYLESSSPNFLGRFLRRTPYMGGHLGRIYPREWGGCTTILPQQQPLESVSPPQQGRGLVVRPCLIAPHTQRGTCRGQGTRGGPGQEKRWPQRPELPGAPMAPPNLVNW